MSRYYRQLTQTLFDAINAMLPDDQQPALSAIHSEGTNRYVSLNQITMALEFAPLTRAAHEAAVNASPTGLLFSGGVFKALPVVSDGLELLPYKAIDTVEFRFEGNFTTSSGTIFGRSRSTLYPSTIKHIGLSSLVNTCVYDAKIITTSEVGTYRLANTFWTQADINIPLSIGTPVNVVVNVATGTAVTPIVILYIEQEA